MPYPEYEQIPCKNCGHILFVWKVRADESHVCPKCNHVILIKIVTEDGGFNKPDPRHLC
jgi:DNA-directed RNA polymerase subunit RPC12/RpoP